MFFVCGVVGGKFGIKDTLDDVVEYYSKEDLATIIKNNNVKILGLCNNKVRVLPIPSNIKSFNDLAVSSFIPRLGGLSIDSSASLISENELLVSVKLQKSGNRTIKSKLSNIINAFIEDTNILVDVTVDKDTVKFYFK